MTLAYQDQYRLAMLQDDFANRVAAAVFAAAIAAFNATPLLEPKQTQRMTLVKQVVQNPLTASVTFKWLVVSQSSLTVEAGLTDAFIGQVVLNSFDVIAQQLISIAPPPS